ncbi:19032_t:CDS:2 [Gigaspora rosea]|nr:19032_t:CDS:2 [Gigaspora rosea]
MEKETGLSKNLCETSIIEKETGLSKDQCETSIMEKEAGLSEDLHKTSNKNKIKFKAPYNNTNNKPQVNRRTKSKTPYQILKFKKKKLKSKRKHLNETRSNLEERKDATDSSLQPSNGDTTSNAKQKKQEKVMYSPDSPLAEDSQETPGEIYYSNEFFDPSQ